MTKATAPDATLDHPLTLFDLQSAGCACRVEHSDTVLNATKFALMDESYTLVVGPAATAAVAATATINAPTTLGALRGLETFAQLIDFAADPPRIAATPITVDDTPRFGWRGLRIDTSRHFLPVSALTAALDVMAAVKLNVFMWHIVDGNSFPLQSARYPELSEKGAYCKECVYSPTDVQQVVKWARQRGIRYTHLTNQPTNQPPTHPTNHPTTQPPNQSSTQASGMATLPTRTTQARANLARVGTSGAPETHGTHGSWVAVARLGYRRLWWRTARVRQLRLSTLDHFSRLSQLYATQHTPWICSPQHPRTTVEHPIKPRALAVLAATQYCRRTSQAGKWGYSVTGYYGYFRRFFPLILY